MTDEVKTTTGDAAVPALTDPAVDVLAVVPGQRGAKGKYRPWPRSPQYLIGDDGTVLGPSGRIRKLRVDRSKGYYTFGYWDVDRKRVRTVSVHIVVAEAWHGPRPVGHEVAHYNGIRTDNRAANLRWATREENHADKRRHGTNPQGERQGASKLTEPDVLAIRDAYVVSGDEQGQIAARYGVTQTTISDIIHGRTWAHLGPVANIPDPGPRRVASRTGERNHRSRFTVADVQAIRAAWANGGVTATQLAQKYGVSKSGIEHVIYRRVWKNV